MVPPDRMCEQAERVHAPEREREREREGDRDGGRDKDGVAGKHFLVKLGYIISGLGKSRSFFKITNQLLMLSGF